jgi:hypothetical protein
MAGGEKSKPGFGSANFERRKHPRSSIDLPVEYFKMDDAISGVRRTGDLSEGGLLLYFSEQMEYGQILRLKLFLQSGSALNLGEGKAEVVWKEYRFAEGGPCRAGVKLVDIAPEEMKKFRKFLNDLVNLKTQSAKEPLPGFLS